MERTAMRSIRKNKFPRAAFGADVIVETPIPKAKRSGIGKLNNPAKRRVDVPQLALGFIPVIWLGREGSNLRMQESKSCVLPLDDAPICLTICHNDRAK